MPLIPAQLIVEKETLSLRLDRDVHERLKQYAAFIQSPKDYVIGQALRRLFDKDHEFTEWLSKHETATPGTGTVENATGGEPRARLSVPAQSAPPRRERSA